MINNSHVITPPRSPKSGRRKRYPADIPDIDFDDGVGEPPFQFDSSDLGSPKKVFFNLFFFLKILIFLRFGHCCVRKTKNISVTRISLNVNKGLILK